MKGRIKAADNFKISTKAIKATSDLFEDSDISYPFIVHVQKKHDLLHYYVVLDVKKDKITIADPDRDVGIVHMLKEDLLEEWTGVAIFFQKGENYQPIIEKTPTLWDFQQLIVKRKRLLVPIFLSAVIIASLELISAYFFQNLIDSFIPNKLISEMTIISIGLVMGYLCSSVAMYLNRYLILKLERHISKNIIVMYIKHVFHLPMNFFASRTNGDIISRFQDTEKIVSAISSVYVVGILQTSIFITLGIVLLLQNAHLFFVSLLGIPIYIFIIVLFIKPFEKQSNQVMSASEKVTSELISDFSCMEAIKAMNWGDVLLHKNIAKLDSLLDATQKFMQMDQMQKTIKQLIDQLLEITVLVIGAHEIFAHRMSLGELVAFNTLLRYFMNPLQDIIGLQAKVQTAKVALNRFYEVLSLSQESLNFGDDLFLEGTKFDIELKNVCFGYGDGNFVLTDMSCSIAHRQKILVKGKSGCGKSTFAKLLAGFQICDEGQILIGKQNIENLDYKELRKHVLYVPQTTFVFNTTIIENLLMDNTKLVDENKIREVCKLVGLDKVIEQLPLGLDTPIGEHGSKLSGGQKQRICLARALLTDAKILILDESTSSLDVVSEEQIIKNICGLTSKTVVIIAHRLEIEEHVDSVMHI